MVGFAALTATLLAAVGVPVFCEFAQPLGSTSQSRRAGLDPPLYDRRHHKRREAPFQSQRSLTVSRCSMAGQDPPYEIVFNPPYGLIVGVPAFHSGERIASHVSAFLIVDVPVFDGFSLRVPRELQQSINITRQPIKRRYSPPPYLYFPRLVDRILSTRNH